MDVGDTGDLGPGKDPICGEPNILYLRSREFLVQWKCLGEQTDAGLWRRKLGSTVQEGTARP
jgi:hypothetical protein